MHLGVAMRPRRDRFIVAIAGFRLVKAIALVFAAVGVVHAREWVAGLPFHHEHAAVDHAIAFITRMPVTRVRELAVAFVAYALLFTVEGGGLLMRKLWAEWLTIIATASLIPFEVYEVVRKMTALRIAAVVINVVIVVYLVRRRFLRENSQSANKGEST